MPKTKKGLADILKNLDKVERWSRQGLTEEKIAKKFGISRATFWEYKKDNPDIVDALKKGRTDLVDDLKETLYKKAVGFRYTETKTITRDQGDQTVITTEVYDRYSPPDVAAAHLLLKNYDENWRNDDMETVRQRRKKIEIAQDKAEAENW